MLPVHTGLSMWAKPPSSEPIENIANDTSQLKFMTPQESMLHTKMREFCLDLRVELAFGCWAFLILTFNRI